MRWADAVQKYFKEHSDVHHVPQTGRMYKTVLGQFEEFVRAKLSGTEIFLESVTRELVQGYQRFRLDAGRSRSTVNTDLRHLSAFLTWCRDSGLCAQDPGAGVKLLRVAKSDKAERFATEEEIRKLIEQFEREGNALYADIVRIFANVGLRRGELLYLTTDDVNLEKRILHVRNKADHLLKDKEDRCVRLNDVAAAALERRVAAVPPGGLLFPSKSGTRIDDRNALKVLQRAAATIGSPHLNFQALRHTFGTMSTAAIGDVATAAQMGHASPETTRKNYVHPEHMNLPAPPEIGVKHVRLAPERAAAAGTPQQGGAWGGRRRSTRPPAKRAGEGAAILSGPGPCLWTSAVRRYQEEYAVDHHSPKSAIRNLVIFRRFQKHMTAFTGTEDFAIGLVSRDHIEAFRVAGLRASARCKTVDLSVRVLKGLFRWCLRAGILNNDPSSGVARSREIERPADRPLAPEVVGQILAHLDKTRSVLYGDLVRLALYAGLRPGEFLKLTARDVDLESRRLSVPTRTSDEASDDPLYREVSFDEAAVEVLGRRIRMAAQRGDALGHLFPTTAQRSNYIEKMTRTLREKLKAAGVPDVGWPELRDVFAWSAAERMEQRELARMLGFSDPSCAERYYARRAGLKLIPGSRVEPNDAAQSSGLAREAQ